MPVLRVFEEPGGDLVSVLLEVVGFAVIMATAVEGFVSSSMRHMRQSWD
jgi:hypothetical protein